jgi:hypothetical protein
MFRNPLIGPTGSRMKSKLANPERCSGRRRYFFFLRVAAFFFAGAFFAAFLAFFTIAALLAIMMAVVEQCPRESRTLHPDYYRT